MAEALIIDSLSIELRSSKRAKRLGLRATPRGVVLTKPVRVSTRQAELFAKQHSGWIKKHHIQPPPIETGMLIGTSHRLIINEGESNRTKIANGLIRVTLDRGSSFSHRSNYIERACIKALRQETRQIANSRLVAWQKKLKLTPNAVRIRNSTTRWGSCSSKGNLNFSVYLAQLPPEEQDYIIVHELTHLAHANHQAEFWKIVETHIKDFKAVRASLKQRPLHINPKNH